jgi:hypothetical protein
VTAGGGAVRLPAPSRPGDYHVYALGVDAGARVTDTLVDLAPGTFRIGITEMRVTGGPPARPVPVVLRAPGPTDPPLLSIAPLRRIATALGDGHPTGRWRAARGVAASRLRPVC